MREQSYGLTPAHQREIVRPVRTGDTRYSYVLLHEDMYSCKACVTCRTFKSFEAFYNEKRQRDGKMNECIACNKASRAKYRSSNRQKERDRWKKYNAASPEVARSRVKRWRKANRGMDRAKKKMREAQKILACPSWAKTKAIKEQILAHYLHAEWLEQTTGIQFHVDHIVPLRNDFVCGLHVPSNLMVLSAEDNIKKNAYWWPEQLDCQKGKGVSQSWWVELRARIDCGEEDSKLFEN